MSFFAQTSLQRSPTEANSRPLASVLRLRRRDGGEKLTKVLPVLGAVKERLPKEYVSIVAGWYDGYISGQTESEIIAAARGKLFP